jgi:hypothetical protein
MVGRKGQGRQRCSQMILPIGELRFEHVARQPFALLASKVGVLDRQRRQRGWPPSTNAL